jgi:diaminohydroxyphosphoribosylaminopyrimidine deaminase / 5-amino-6-(5-phosphoribosylamino)uracil reductase
MMNLHERLMKRALDLALKAKGQTSPNPMVGCVIVRNGKVIAEDYHRRCGEDHAEVIALKKAGTQAKGATIYVNLEPCHHFGRTPPCVDTIISSGIKEVVIGQKDPNPLTNGKSIQKLKKAGIKVTIGVLENECKRMNEFFNKYIALGMPYVVAKTAQTLDGKIATSTGDSKWITSESTRAFARAKRDEFDAILVGINTVLKDDPSLNGIKKAIKKIVVDSELKLSLKAKLFKGVRPADCFIATTKKADVKKVDSFRKKGLNVFICPLKGGHVDLAWFLKELAKNEITSVLIEGGATVIGSALKANLVDKMHIYVAPKIVGDERALSSIVGNKITKINQTIKLNQLEIQRLNEDLLITAYVHRNR